MMKLLEHYQSANLELSNRVVMAPMTRSRADNKEGLANSLMATYYAQRASAGLIISEGIHVSSRAIGSVHVPGIYTAPQVASWKQVTDAVHDRGGKIFAQLWHVGRISHPDLLDGLLPLAPSAINPEFKAYSHKGFARTPTPAVMNHADIQQTIADFKNAAVNAMAAGFDGVELHAANGYLFHQFFAKCANERTDEYGGTIENRCRFLFDVLQAISTQVSLSKVAVRIAPSLNHTFGIVTDEETRTLFEYLVTRLNDYNLAYLHISGFTLDKSDDPLALVLATARHYRKFYKGTYMINKGFTRDTANTAIEEGIADLVSFGELFISNPDLVERFSDNSPLLMPDRSTYYVAGPKGYTDYPFRASESG